MKKTYINPSVTIVNVQTDTMMQQVSGFSSTLNTTGGAGSSALSNETDIFDETAQGGSIWDEEE